MTCDFCSVWNDTSGIRCSRCAPLSSVVPFSRDHVAGVDAEDDCGTDAQAEAPSDGEEFDWASNPLTEEEVVAGADWTRRPPTEREVAVELGYVQRFAWLEAERSRCERVDGECPPDVAHARACFERERRERLHLVNSVLLLQQTNIHAVTNTITANVVVGDRHPRCVRGGCTRKLTYKPLKSDPSANRYLCATCNVYYVVGPDMIPHPVSPRRYRRQARGV